jgi:RNA polymerase sigma factor (sigma-70 family)
VTWLYSIAMNLCRDYGRSKQRRQSYATESLDASEANRNVASADRGPAAHVESHERLANLQKAIEKLPHDLRTTLLLFAVEGRSQQECAELLGVSAKAVETRVYRARKILEKKIPREGTG